jgi:hypothetical protein
VYFSFRISLTHFTYFSYHQVKNRADGGGKTKGDDDVASIHALKGKKPSLVDNSRRIDGMNVIGVQANNEPASKTSPEGSQICNLSEHRVTAGVCEKQTVFLFLSPRH